jgi:hypothetical protein
MWRITLTVFMDVLCALAEAEVSFVVTGGTAMCLHGITRPVADLDIVVQPVEPNLSLVALRMREQGFYPTLPLPLSAVAVMRMLDRRGREVDVNRLYPIKYDALINDAVWVPVSNCFVAIASKNHLVAVKRQRARDYDLVDIQLLERAENK